MQRQDDPQREAVAAAFTPTDIQKAYNLKGLKSQRHGRDRGRLRLPDPRDGPRRLPDYYKLPKCTTSNGCLNILDQRGGHTTPPTDSGWDLEQALDLDTVSAACPDCKIVIVQSDTNSFKNLGAAVDTAAKQKGVVAISNSYSAAGPDVGEQGRLRPPRHRCRRFHR